MSLIQNAFVYVFQSPSFISISGQRVKSWAPLSRQLQARFKTDSVEGEMNKHAAAASSPQQRWQ